MRPSRVNPLRRKRPDVPGLPGLTRGPSEADSSVCPGEAYWAGQMEERGWAYRWRQPGGSVLYEAVRDNLATLLAEASEVGCGLPRYVKGEPRWVWGQQELSFRCR
jgi:hypothetical protein